MKIILLSGSVFLAFAVSASASTYYSSPSGSGTTCSATSPCSLSSGLSKAISGDELVLKNGTYNTYLDTRSDGVVIRAENKHQAIISNGSGSGTLGAQLVTIKNNNVTIRGLRIDGQKTAGGTVGMVRFYASSGIILEDNIIENAAGALISVGGSVGSALINNVIMRNNLIQGSGFQVEYGEAIYIGKWDGLPSTQQVWNVEFYGNTIRDFGENGFDLKPPTYDIRIHHNLIEGQVMKPLGRGNFGIIAMGGNTADVHDNIFRNNVGGDSAVRTDSGGGNKFYSNVVNGTTNTNYAINTESGDNGGAKTQITNNRFCNLSSTRVNALNGIIISNNAGLDAPTLDCVVRENEILAVMGGFSTPITGKVTALGITQAEIDIWKQRAVSGPYKSAGDQGAFSPGDWDRIVANKNTFMSSAIDSSDVWDGYTGSGCVPRDSAISPNSSIGNQMRDAAFYSLIMGDSTVRDKVKSALLVQIAKPGTDYSNASKWCLDSANWIGHTHPAFVAAEMHTHQLLAYDYIRHAIDSTSRNSIDAWFRNAGIYFRQNAHLGMIQNSYGTAANFLAGILNSNGQSRAVDCSGYGQTHLNGNNLCSLGGFFNNRAAHQNTFFGLIGVMLNMADEKNWAAAYFREYIKYYVYPDSTLHELDRSHGTNAALGWAYSGQTFGKMAMLADAFARAGDTSLFDYSTTAGGGPTAGGPKSLRTVANFFRDTDQNTKVIYNWNTSVNIANQINAVWYPDNFYGYDTFLALVNLYYNDASLKNAYSSVGPVDKQGTNTNREPDFSFMGPGRALPGVLFMFGQMEGRANPYGGIVTTPAPTISLSASPSAITSGQSSTISWSSTNATSCTASGDSSWTGTKSIAGTQAVTPTSNTTYTLACTGAGGTATQSATVSVTSPSTKFSINDRIYVTSGSVNVRQTPAGTLLGTQATGVQGIVTDGPIAAVLNGTSYNWWNINFDSGIDGWVGEGPLEKVTVIPVPTVSLTANPSTIAQGQSSILTWSSTNVTSCTASGDSSWTGTKATSGTQSVTPTSNTTYTLACTGIGGSASQSATVSVSSVTPPGTNLVSSLTKISDSNNFAIDHPITHLWDNCTDVTPLCTTGNSTATSFWVEFDFGAIYDLSSSRLFGDSDGNWVSNSWTLQYKKNIGDAWTTAFTNSNAFGAQWFDQALTGTQARHARVTVNGGTGGTQARELQIYGTLSVVQPTPTFDFSLTNEGSKSVTQGSSVTNIVTATLSSGTSQAVSFTTTASPAFTGGTASYSPISCTPNCSTTITLNAGTTTPTGNYTFNVTATGGEVTKTTSFTLTVNSLTLPPPACSDSLDNDGDAKIDYPSDPGCSSASDTDETDPVIIDTTPPLISNLASTNITANSAILSWTTNEPATTQAGYGLNSCLNLSTTKNTSLTASHAVTLSGLSSGTTYYYCAKSDDASGNGSISIQQSFTTQILVPDSLPPAAITSLYVTRVSAQSADIQWNATGDDGLAGIASSYDIRWATTPITETSWTSANQVTGEPTPVPSGFSRKYTFVGLPKNTKIYAALKSQDEAGNNSPLSNVVFFTTKGSTSAFGSSPLYASLIVSPLTQAVAEGAEDTTPSSPVSNFTARGANSQILLMWENPVSADWVRTKIIRNSNHDPKTPEDGTLVYDGVESSALDANLANNVRYSYAAFTYDEVPNYSSPQYAYGIPIPNALSFTISGTETSVATITQAVATPGITLIRTLVGGSRGADVAALQDYLIQRGFLMAGNNTGYFGPLTEAAVQALQRNEGIVNSGTPQSTGYGVVGPKTRDAIRQRLIAPSPINSVPLTEEERIQRISTLQNAILELMERMKSLER